jgi:hypothetical protein
VPPYSRQLALLETMKQQSRLMHQARQTLKEKKHELSGKMKEQRHFKKLSQSSFATLHAEALKGGNPFIYDVAELEGDGSGGGGPAVSSSSVAPPGGASYHISRLELGFAFCPLFVPVPSCVALSLLTLRESKSVRGGRDGVEQLRFQLRARAVAREPEQVHDC